MFPDRMIPDLGYKEQVPKPQPGVCFRAPFQSQSPVQPWLRGWGTWLYPVAGLTESPATSEQDAGKIEHSCIPGGPRTKAGWKQILPLNTDHFMLSFCEAEQLANDVSLVCTEAFTPQAWVMSTLMLVVFHRTHYFWTVAELPAYTTLDQNSQGGISLLWNSQQTPKNVANLTVRTSFCRWNF